MSSLERKVARRQQKAANKLEKKLAKKLNMFDSLPKNCLVCNESYDRKNKKQATTWSVVVKPDKVRLYCPACWSKAKELVEKIKETVDDNKDSNNQ
jgi:ribosomal protein L44E